MQYYEEYYNSSDRTQKIIIQTADLYESVKNLIRQFKRVSKLEKINKYIFID